MYDQLPQTKTLALSLNQALRHVGCVLQRKVGLSIGGYLRYAMVCGATPGQLVMLARYLKVQRGPIKKPASCMSSWIQRHSPELQDLLKSD